MKTYVLTPEDQELAEYLEDSMPSGFLYPAAMLSQMAASTRQLFFRVVAPKYGFNPDTAKWAGSRDNPSWDILAEPLELTTLEMLKEVERASQAYPESACVICGMRGGHGPDCRLVLLIRECESK